MRILLLRFRQAFRISQDLGILRFCLLLFILLIAFSAFYIKAEENPVFQWWLSFPGPILVLLIHFSRNDINFLDTVFQNKGLFFVTEYAFVALFPIIILFITNHIPEGIICLLSSLLVAFIPKVKFFNTDQGLNFNWLPNTAFEWKAGLRTSWMFIAGIWIGAVVFAQYELVIPVAMIVITYLVITFYEENESFNMMLAVHQRMNGFLKLKLKIAFGLLLLMVFPLIFLFLLYHIEIWFYPFVLLIILLSVLLYSIILKYAFYDHLSDGNGAKKVFQIFGLMSLIMPFILPAIWIMTFRYYFKAIKNLKRYPYAENK